jgi:hypothetical protein
MAVNSQQVTPTQHLTSNTPSKSIQFTTQQLSPRFTTTGTVGGMATTRKPKRVNSVNVRMDDGTLSKLRAIAEREKRTVSNLIDWVVSRWLEEQEREAAKRGE